jgi:pseudouridine synthase
VAHPRYGGSKTYDVKVKGEPSEGALDQLREGIVLEGKRTAPARITRRSKGHQQRRRGGDDDEGGQNTWWVVELTEGRTRQIREMFQRIGHPVQKLRRVAIGPLRDPHLLPGALRELTEREVETLRRITARPKKKKAVGEKKSAPAKTEGAKKAGVKRAPAKKKPLSPKRAAQGEPPKKAPARKSAAKKAPARKTGVKRAPAKKGAPGRGRRP